MWGNIIQTCQETLEKNKAPLPAMVSHLTQELSPYYESHFFKGANTAQEKDNPDTPLPYGRYLIHQDAKKRFHIEIHVFSENYTGSIHNHETWGIFWLISGALFVEDFLYDGGRPKPVRSGLIKRGSASNFHPPESDWHRVRTLDHKEQTLSLHIYGAGYDQVHGKYLDEHNQLLHEKRGPLKPSSQIESAIGVV